MNVLDLVKSVCGVIGIPQPNSLIGTTDRQIIQLRELLNNEGTDLSARHSTGWNIQVREATFTTVATEDQGSVETIIGASNAFRHIVNDTIWNRSTRIPVYGPRGGHVWQGYKAFSFAGPYAEYRIRGNHILMLPAPVAGNTCAFEYVTRNWLTGSDDSEKSTITDDADTPMLDTDLIQQGLEWRWRKAKGLDYSQDFEDYESRVMDAIARDGTKARKTIGGPDLDKGIPIAIPRQIGL